MLLSQPLDENDNEFVVVSSITDVESSNVLDIDNENISELSNTSNLEINGNEKTNVKLIDNSDATSANDSVQQSQESVTYTQHKQIKNNNETKSSKTTNVSKSSGIYIFGNKFHSSKHKFETIEKSVHKDCYENGNHVISKSIVTERSDKDEKHDLSEIHNETDVSLHHEMDSSTNGLIEKHEDEIDQQPSIFVTSDIDIDTLDVSSFEHIPNKEVDCEHLIEKKSVVRISRPKKDEDDLREVEPAVVIEPVQVSNIAMDYNSPVDVLDLTEEYTTTIDTNLKVMDTADGKVDVADIQRNVEAKGSSADIQGEETREDQVKTKADDINNAYVEDTDEHDEVNPPELDSTEAVEPVYAEIISNDVIIISPSPQAKEIQVRELHPDYVHSDTENNSDEIEAIGSFEIQATSPVGLEEKNSHIIDEDEPHKMVKDFSLSISEHITKDSLSEHQLMSDSFMVTQTTYIENSSMPAEGDIECSLSVNQQSTRSVKVDGLEIANITNASSIEFPELGENMTMDDLMLKYKDYIDRTDSIEINDILENHPELAASQIISKEVKVDDKNQVEISDCSEASIEIPTTGTTAIQMPYDISVHVTSGKETDIASSSKPIDEGIPTGDYVVVDTSTEDIESPGEILEEPTQTIQIVEATPVYESDDKKSFSGDIDDSTEHKPNVSIEEESGSESGHIEPTQNIIEFSDILIKHRDTNDIHIEGASRTNSAVSIEEVGDVTERTTPVKDSHKKKYRYDVNKDSPEIYLHIESVSHKDKHPGVESSQTDDEIINRITPLEILEEIPEYAEDRDMTGSPRDTQTFQLDHTEIEPDEIWDTAKCKNEEVDGKVNENSGKDTNMMAEQSDVLTSLSEESQKDDIITMVRNVIERQDVDTEIRWRRLESEQETGMINAALEMEIAKTKIIGQNASPSITFTNSLVKEDKKTASIDNDSNDKEDITTSSVALERDFVPTELLHNTSIIINIKKSKENIIDDNGFDNKDIDVQMKTTKQNHTEGCEDYSHPESNELSASTERESSSPDQLEILINKDISDSPKDIDENHLEFEVNIKVNNTETGEIKQLIRGIKEENTHIYATEHFSSDNELNCFPEHDSACDVTRRDKLIEQLLTKMSKVNKLSEENSRKITDLTKQDTFDADFILSLLDKEPRVSPHLIHEEIHNNEISSETHVTYSVDVLPTNKGYIHVNQNMEDPSDHVSGLASIILKRHRSQEETIQLERKNPEMSESFIMITNAESYNSDDELEKKKRNDIDNEQVAGLTAKIEPDGVEKYEDESDVDYVIINYTNVVTTSENLLHDSTPGKTNKISTNIILDTEKEEDIHSDDDEHGDDEDDDDIISFLSQESVTEEGVSTYVIVTESVYEDGTPEEERVIQFPLEMNNVENTMDEARTDDNTTAFETIEDEVNLETVDDLKSPVSINSVDYVDVGLATDIIVSYDEQQLVIEDPFTPIGKANNVIDLEINNDIGSSESLISTEDTIDVKSEPGEVICNDEQPHIVEDPITPIEKANNVIDLENINIGLSETIISTEDTIYVESEPAEVIYYNEQPVIAEDPLMPIEKADNVIDMEINNNIGSSESLISTEDTIDVESEPGEVICYDEQSHIVEDPITPIEKANNVIDLGYINIGLSETIISTENTIYVESEPVEVICYNEQPVIAEDPIMPIEKANNVIDLGNINIGLSETIISTEDTIYVESEPGEVIYYNEQPVIAEDPIMPIEKANNVIDLGNINIGLSETIISTEDTIYVESEPGEVIYYNEQPVIAEDPIMPIEKADNVIDMEINNNIGSSKSLISTEDTIDVESEPGEVICYDEQSHIVEDPITPIEKANNVIDLGNINIGLSETIISTEDTIYVESEPVEVINYNEQPVIAEDPIMPIEKANNVIDLGNINIGLSETIISTEDTIYVESEPGEVIYYNEQPVIAEDPITPMEKANNVIDMEIIDNIESSDPVILTTDTIDVESEPRVVVYYDNETVEEHLVRIERTDVIIDLKINNIESLESIVLTEGEIDVELQPHAVVCNKDHLDDSLDDNLVISAENVNDIESAELILSIGYHDDIKLKTSARINNDTIPTIANDDVITPMEVVDSFIDQEKFDDIETPIEEHITLELNPTVKVGNDDIPIIIDVKVIAPVIKVNTAVDPHINDDNEAPVSPISTTDMLEYKTEIIEISQPPVITEVEIPQEILERSQPPVITEMEIQQEILEISQPPVIAEIEIRQEIFTSEQITIQDRNTVDEPRENLMNDDEIDEEKGSNDFDGFDDPTPGQCSDMITIFKSLRSQIESNIEETPYAIQVDVAHSEPINSNSDPVNAIGFKQDASSQQDESSGIYPLNNDVMDEELYEVYLSKEESGIPHFDETSGNENLIPEEEPTNKVDTEKDTPTEEVVAEESNATLTEPNDIGSQPDNINDNPNASTEISPSPKNVNMKQKLKKRPTASFRSMSNESNTSLLSDKIRKSIESDTHPLFPESTTLESGERPVSTVYEDKDIQISNQKESSEDGETAVTPETLKNLEISSEPEIEDTKTDEDDDEEEKPLYIVCKDVSQTNIITSSRARSKEDEDSLFNTGTPTIPSPIIRLTSVPPHDVQNTPITVTNGNIEITHEKRVIVQTQFFYEQSTGYASPSCELRELHEDSKQQNVVTSNNHINKTEEELVVPNIEDLQEGVPNIYSDENEIDTPEIYDMKEIEVPSIPNDYYEEEDEYIYTFIPLRSVSGDNEPILENVDSCDDITVPQIEDNVDSSETHSYNVTTQLTEETDKFPQMVTRTKVRAKRNTEEITASPLPKYTIKVSTNNETVQPYSKNGTTTTYDKINYTSLNTPEESKKIHCGENVDLVINGGKLVEQPDNQMYCERQKQNIPQQTITLTSRQLPKYQNIYIELRSQGEVPLDDDIDPYLSEIHFKDMTNKWQDQGLLSPTHTSSEKIIINRCSNIPTIKVESDSDSGADSTPCSSSSEFTFNKDLHESLQIFCDGLITGLFKANELADEFAIPETIKNETDLKTNTHIVKDKNNKHDIEKASGRVFKCDAAMLRHELQESLHDGDTTTE